MTRKLSIFQKSCPPENCMTVMVACHSSCDNLHLYSVNFNFNDISVPYKFNLTRTWIVSMPSSTRSSRGSAQCSRQTPFLTSLHTNSGKLLFVRQTRRRPWVYFVVVWRDQTPNFNANMEFLALLKSSQWSRCVRTMYEQCYTHAESTS